MKIGIIGSGNIGSTLAALLVAAGHEVLIANSRGPQSLVDLVAGLGPRARAGTPEEAAGFGEIVVEAIPFGRVTELPAAALKGRILISASNHYPARDGDIDLGGRSQGEYTAAHVPGARVVKAFNTIWSEHLATQGDPSKPVVERRAIFVAGDDPEAKRQVNDLIESIGFGSVNVGDLGAGRRLEPGTAIYNKDLTVAEGREALAQAAS